MCDNCSTLEEQISSLQSEISDLNYEIEQKDDYYYELQNLEDSVKDLKEAALLLENITVFCININNFDLYLFITSHYSQVEDDPHTVTKIFELVKDNVVDGHFIALDIIKEHLETGLLERELSTLVRARFLSQKDSALEETLLGILKSSSSDLTDRELLDLASTIIK